MAILSETPSFMAALTPPPAFMNPAANDNHPRAYCLEFFSLADGWQIRFEIMGELFECSTAKAGAIAWYLAYNRPDLRVAAHDIFESVKRVRNLERPAS